MPHKTFEDETFTLKNLNIMVNDLTATDPDVDCVVLTPEEDSVEEIGYSANKKVEKSAKKKDPVSGIEFDATSEETEDKKLSEIPEKLKKLNSLIQNGKETTIKTNIGRYTNEDGSNTSFYLTDEHIEDMEVVTGDEEPGNEEDEEESDSSQDQDAESQSESADSDEDIKEDEESSTESSEGDLDEQQRSALSNYLSANSVEEVKEYIEDILDDEKLDEYGGAETFLEAVHEAESEGKDRKTVLEYVERQDAFEVSEDSEEEDQDEEDDEPVIFPSEE